jgi:hypothetical protein
MRLRVRPAFICAALGAFMPIQLGAQTTSPSPLSVIEWLDKPAPLAQLPRAPVPKPKKPKAGKEPAVASTGTAPQVTTQSLDAAPRHNVGLAPVAMTGMQPDLWSGSDIETLAHQIANLPELELPAGNALLFTLMVAEAEASPAGGQTQSVLTRARVEKLMKLGAVDPALALIEQAGASTSPELFDLWAALTLLVGTEDAACGALSRANYLSQDMGLRIFCAARNGDWDTASLTYGSAKALSLLPRQTLDVLDRFLNPDLFEDAAPLPVPRKMDPLTFRLFETIGEPLPTGPLPRTYAVADLRDIAGWKSQLEAAERLTRAGALPDNRLLGLYTDRKAAASGGIWDRVRAVQRFDTALGTGSADAVAKTLPDAWREMRQNALEVSFASAFHLRLAGITLTGAAAQIQARIGLLSPDYEIVASGLNDMGLLGDDTALLRAVAQGDLDTARFGSAPTAPLQRAIYDAFTNPQPNVEWIEMSRNQRLGEALIAALGALHDGARGDSLALRQALGTLRSLGLEDMARRAALQILLLDRST